MVAEPTRCQVVTIDGPAGAGKSTAAARLAQRLGWRLLDTGAMYRCVALASRRAGVDPSDDQALGELTNCLRVELLPGLVLLEGEDVTREIRTAEISRRSSLVAAQPSVRARLVGWQRRFAAGGGVVTEGRDQGTVVFPDALLKVFLTASPQERASRRTHELAQAGQPADSASVMALHSERDLRDAARVTAPMRPAADALIFDTTGLELAQVVSVLEALTRFGPPFPWDPAWREVDPARTMPAAVEALAQAWSGRPGRLLAVGCTQPDAERAALLMLPAAGPGPERGS